MSTLGWLKDEELKPSETQLPAAETQLAVSGLIMSSTVLPAIPNDIAMTPQNHTTKSMICQYQPWDMKCWISFWHHPQQKKTPSSKVSSNFSRNHGVSTAIAASTGSPRGCQGLWQWNVAAAGTATTTGATCCDAWRKRWVKGMTVFQAESCSFKELLIADFWW